MRRTVILDGEFSIYCDITIEKWKLQIACHNLQPAQIAGFIWISITKTPSPIPETGLL